MNASASTPSTRHALSTFAFLLGVPVVTFCVATVWALKVSMTQPSWNFLLLIYAVGTLPGLVVGTRYPASAIAKTTFAVAYVVVSVGMLVATSLTLGCLLTDVCL